MLLDYRMLFNILFPLSDDERIIADLPISHFVTNESTRSIGDIIVLSHFKNKEVRAAIHLTKFHNHKKAKQMLAQLLHAHIQTYSHQPTIIPIPLSRKRFRERGYNQVSVVVASLPNEHTNVTLADNVLERVRNTPPQTSLKRTDRMRNVTGAFSVRDTASAHNAIMGKHILLLDDVVTTGATLHAAKASLLRHAPASITCVALAH